MKQAFAKINLGLFVLNKREDSFHNLLTVFHRINVFDRITLEPSPAIRVESSDPEAPGGETNICHKAARLLQEHIGSTQGVTIIIQKGIPVGAGLGGGSADAAFILRTLPPMWGVTVREEELCRIALQLGSDVPYFLKEGTAVALGRGEILTYFPLEIPYAILLCNPNIHVSTGWAYGHVTPKDLTPLPDLSTQLMKGMADPQILRQALHNDFEEPVFAQFPTIRQIKERMLHEGAVFALMSGSGSSVYGFFSDELHARTTARIFLERGYKTYVTAPRFTPT